MAITMQMVTVPEKNASNHPQATLELFSQARM
jgi:hypothetical protein